MLEPIAWILGGVLALAMVLLALAGFLYWFRRTPLRTIRDLDGGADVPAVDRPDFLKAVQHHLGTHLAGGHRVEVLFNGEETYDRLFEDLGRAESLITWHVFWFRRGRLAARLKDVLSDRAHADVRVLLLHDWFGTDVGDGYLRDLREAGVETATFRKPTPDQLYKANQRSHVRAVVVDGTVGYTGGFAIADEWTGDGRSRDSWRDTNVRFEGPAVHQLQTAFASEWVEATGELLVGPRVFPGGNGVDRPEEGGSEGATGGPSAPGGSDGVGPDRRAVAGLFQSAPSLGGTRAERFFALSLMAARETCFVTAGYFVPNAHFRRLLCAKARDGVDVRVLHPGRNTDRPATWWAARRHYEQLLRAGVRVYEYAPAMVHAKTLVVDRTWCAVGTANFDNRSMALNDEVSLLARDTGVGSRLHDRFLQDIGDALEVDAERHAARGWHARLLERAADLVSPVL